VSDSIDPIGPPGHRSATCDDLPRQVLDSLHEGFQVISPDYRYLYVNDAAAAHGRTTREQLLGRTMVEAYPGIESSEMFSLLRRCMEKREAVRMENQFTFGDGSTNWFEFRFERVPEGVVVLSLDIEARKQAEARVSHLNAVLRGIRDVNQLITRERDPQALIQKACDLLARSRGFFACCVVLHDGQRITASAEAGDEGKLRALRRTLARGELPVCMEHTLHQGGIVVRQVPRVACEGCPINQDYLGPRDVVAIRLECQGKTFGVLLASMPSGLASDPEERDLLREVAGDLAFALRSIELRTRRNRAEEKLAREHERYGELVANLEDVVFSSDTEGRIVFMSPAVERVYGFAPAEVVGRHFSEFALPEDVPALVANFERTLAGSVEPHEFRGFDKSGCLRHLRVTSRVRMRAGRPDGVDGVIMDFTRLVEANEALRQSELRYRSLFENTSVGIAHCRMLYGAHLAEDFVFLDVNPAFESLTGLRDVAGKLVTEVIPGVRQSDPRLFEILGKAARSQLPERFEIYLAALRQWLDISVYGVQPDHFVMIADVVTKRKQTEANLVTFSQRLERLTQVVQDLSQARTLETVVDVVRQAARALVGSDGATFIVRDGDQCHYLDEDAIGPLWKGKRFPMSACISGWAMTHREPVVIQDIYEDERIPQDAYRSTFVRSLVLVPIRRLKPIGVIGSYWASKHCATPDEVRILQALGDSTSFAMENVRILHELEEEKARTRAIYEHLPKPTIVWQREDAGFTLADFNEAAKAMTSRAMVDLAGRQANEFRPPLPQLAEDLERCYQQRGAARREVECSMPGSTAPRRLILTYGFIPTDMVVLHIEDVTEQRHADEHLKLVQRLEAVGRLAGGVAHDFNNLLSVIISCAGFALETLRESDPAREEVLQIQSAAQRAVSLTSQLLAFGRRQILQPEVLNLNTVFAGIEGMLRRLLHEDVHLRLELAHDLGNVVADRGQIEQVVVNLAVNAGDAMPQGGALTIITTNVELDESYASQHIAVQPGPYVMLSVSDTGCGMDARDRERIFEPFYTTKEMGRGTGLGLSTVYGIVKQSGGSIWVYSEPGQGSTFKVYLPRVDAPESEVRRRPDTVLATGTETLLVVEDDEPLRSVAVRILQSAGYRVLSASTGAEALQLCGQSTSGVDLFVTDVVMPEMSGGELAERLHELNPRVKVLFMSGYSTNGLAHHGILETGRPVIIKPFSAVELTHKVREALDSE